MMKETITISVLLAIGAGIFLTSCDEEMAKYTFPHKPHFEEEISCDACHEVDDGGMMMMPVFDSCLTCHDEEPEKFTSCDQCHSDPKTLAFDGESIVTHQTLFAKYIPPSWDDVEMNHEAYVDMGEESCMQCHQNIQNTMHSTIANLPSMKETMDFHHEQSLSNDCQTCHKELNRLTPPASHNASWDTQHGFAKEFQNMDSCLLCHQEDTCNTCHQTQAPKNHNNLWRKQTHGIQAAFDRDSCLVCHRNDECTSCHIAAAAPVPGASFHTPEADCMACHSPQGAPRTANRFLKPMPHRLMMGMSSSKCLSCHLF